MAETATSSGVKVDELTVGTRRDEDSAVFTWHGPGVVSVLVNGESVARLRPGEQVVLRQASK
jgi:hypothetical protein